MIEYKLMRRLIGSNSEWEIVIKKTNSWELSEILDVLKKFEPEYEYRIM